jgi:hypothetical protein
MPDSHHYYYELQNYILRSGRIKWMKQAACMEEIKKAYIIVARKHEKGNMIDLSIDGG